MTFRHLAAASAAAVFAFVCIETGRAQQPPAAAAQTATPAPAMLDVQGGQLRVTTVATGLVFTGEELREVGDFGLGRSTARLDKRLERAFALAQTQAAVPEAQERLRADRLVVDQRLERRRRALDQRNSSRSRTAALVEHLGREPINGDRARRPAGER